MRSLIRPEAVDGAICRFQYYLKKCNRADPDVLIALSKGEHGRAEEGHRAESCEKNLQDDQTLAGLTLDDLEIPDCIHRKARGGGIDQDVENGRRGRERALGRVAIARDNLAEPDRRTDVHGGEVAAEEKRPCRPECGAEDDKQ